MDNPTNPNNDVTNTKDVDNNTKDVQKTEPKDTASLEARIKQLESENGKLKQAQTNASADASAWKKKYQDTLSEQDKAKAQQDEAYAAMQEKLTALETERNIAQYTASLTASDIGMDADTAKAVAEALNSGETDKVFEGIRSFITSHDKALAEKAMKNNPTLPGGASTKTVTKEEFNNMGYKEMLAFKTEHPDLYAEYMKS